MIVHYTVLIEVDDNLLDGYDAEDAIWEQIGDLGNIGVRIVNIEQTTE